MTTSPPSETSCRELETHLQLYRDGELDEADLGRVEAHLAGCAHCRAAVESSRRLAEQLRTATAAAAPARLRHTILRAVTRESRPFQLIPTLQWSVALASVIVAATLGVRTLLIRSRANDLATAAVEHHQRLLPLDIKTADFPAVQSFLDGRVDFPPSRIPELRQVSLLGGRLSSFGDRPAAYVAYGDEHQHRVSLFVFNGGDLTVPGARKVADRDVFIANQHGYNVAIWNEGGITYSLVSDLDEQQVLDLIASSPHR